MKSWIVNTKINALLGASSQKFDGVKVRRILIEYCDRYQKIYPFEILEEPLEFLKNNVDSDSKYREMRALLRVAAEEYCISLNEIADALLDLIDIRVLTTDQAKKLLTTFSKLFPAMKAPKISSQERMPICAKIYLRLPPASKWLKPLALLTMTGPIGVTRYSPRDIFGALMTGRFWPIAATQLSNDIGLSPPGGKPNTLRIPLRNAP